MSYFEDLKNKLKETLNLQDEVLREAKLLEEGSQKLAANGHDYLAPMKRTRRKFGSALN